MGQRKVNVGNISFLGVASAQCTKLIKFSTLTLERGRSGVFGSNTSDSQQTQDNPIMIQHSYDKKQKGSPVNSPPWSLSEKTI